MNQSEIRKKLNEVAAKMAAIEAGPDGYTAEQEKLSIELNTEFAKLNSQLATAERVESARAALTTSAGRQTDPVNPQPQQGALPRTEVAVAAAIKYHGFPTLGGFLSAVKESGISGKADDRFNFHGASVKEAIGEDGGFLVPEEMAAGINRKLEKDDESLMGKATVYPVSGNAITMKIDESLPWSSGITAYWVAEGTAITGSKPKFKLAHWRLQKVAALVDVTDEMLEDATFMAGYIEQSAPNAIMYAVNKSIISGLGVGKPLGIIQSPFTVTVLKESMQSADTIVARNIAKMWSAMFPGSRANAIWLINPACEVQLKTLVDDNGNFMYLGPGGLGSQLNSTPYALLLGRPVLPLLGGMPALGDLGDIMFVDMKFYWMIKKAQGVKYATSIHLNFDKETTAFRFSLRLDGKSPFQSPVTTEFGSYNMSAFVMLEAR